MKVILLKELKGRGGEGDVIDVAPGFANNYLLTQGYAIKATKGNLKQLEQRRNNIAKREDIRIANANKMAERLNNKDIYVVAQVGEEGQLFGSVTTQMIADAIKESLDIDVDRRRIELGKPIKVAGAHPVEISIYREIRATVNVVVGGPKTEEKEEAAEGEDIEADETIVTQIEEVEEADGADLDITAVAESVAEEGTADDEELNA